MNKNQRIPDEATIIIFGVTGDLTRRKLMPALYELNKNKQLPKLFRIVGFARRPWTDDILSEKLHGGINNCSRNDNIDEDVVKNLLENTHYLQSTFEDERGYENLEKYLKDVNAKNLLFYLATPPDAYNKIIKNIGKVGLNNVDNGWTRIVIEKPYGVDLDSAISLEEEVHRVFSEDQIYRIDHYLGKETVQNILVFRFANGIFDPLWDRKYVDNVQITVSETVGVGTRAGYYEKVGVIRDMFQNHLLQLLSLTAMEAPVSFNPEAVRDEKVKVLRALRPMTDNNAINNTYRAQYVSGFVNGNKVKGYKEEDGVSNSSITETFLIARLFIDNWRWAGVPFYIRSGKTLPKRTTSIAIHFKQIPLSLFDWHNMAGDAPNVLVLNLQPDEGIKLTFGAKIPGPVNEITPVTMDFSYRESFGEEPPDAYERLLLDCILGDATLFTRSDEVKYQWEFISNILSAWENNPVNNLPIYEAGTWGPPGADEFIGSDKRKWYNPV